MAALPTIALLGAAMLQFIVLCTQGATNPAHVSVLKELLQNVGGQAKLPSWVGSDPCGSPIWDHIQCEGDSVIGLQLQNLKLHGELPATLNDIATLEFIALQGNSFTGPLPSFRGLSRLQTAYLDFQNFTSIPPDFFQGLSSLTLLSMDYSPLNKSSGGWSLPTDVAHLQKLSTLSLTSTFLVGPIPSFLATLPNLQYLHLAYNYLSGSIPAVFSSANLVSLQLNNQVGRIPLSGSIAPIAEIQSLSQLWLQVNSFSGPIPEKLGELLSLTDVRLNDNQLVGPIPSSFSASTALSTFYVQHNHLDGALPEMPSLSPANFTYDGNGFCSDKRGVPCTQEVEALLGFLGGVGYPMDLAMSWTGDDACAWIGITCDPSKKAVITVNLPRRNLVGSLSNLILNLTYLQNLILNDNNLTGAIPPLSSLRFLRHVGLQNNNFSAPLPDLPPGVLNVSGNPLLDVSVSPPLMSPTKNNPVPVSTALHHTPSAENKSFVSPDFSSPSNVIRENGHSSDKRSVAGVVAGSITGALCLAFLTATLLFFVVKKRKKYSRVRSPNSTVLMHPSGALDDPDTLKLTLSNRSTDLGETSQAGSMRSGGVDGVQVVESGNLLISIQVLRNVTDNFSQKNIVGKGGFGVVYKGELDDGTKIAVKRMQASVVSSKGLQEFQSEIAVLTRVRHRHLVSLLGYCIHGNERLLAYEYMPLGPLSQHLFDYVNLNLPPLTIMRRFSIALDVARGMEYLHGLAHEASFIHRDLKSSNILLGDDYRAKVSDFGLVRLASEDKTSIETRLAGTFGYLAPEYAVTGRVTTKSDVFSFGVVLMELITGRKALDETAPEESVHLVAWFRRMCANLDDLRAAIDPAIELTDESFQSMLIVAELARHCTNREAWQRPDMSHAVNVLSPLVEKWKPAEVDGEEGIGIDLDMTLPQALKKWQAYEGTATSSESGFLTHSDLENTISSMPSRPAGFADSFTSNDGR
ncbi:hypothetical protein KP509_04G074100 [Ceratopteris richardii]|nr:hypothetical protein KP509_04G074100 [Ceratopteris richardii]KAH7439740.1 hypothetical protein KP509_04G074100 [Ceratopteris richardii]KAH7439741.1 hypothetical protein KP509_04G074100 [Ceratopteris richardii]KAH7439742.1 hypothetical protein KP509_04G074100 [Ceratopteris richardii]